jgi:hypothetical protein
LARLPTQLSSRIDELLPHNRSEFQDAADHGEVRGREIGRSDDLIQMAKSFESLLGNKATG